MTEENADPLALQLAVRVEKLDPPNVDHVLAATALAVIALLADERTKSGGEWFAAVDAWNGARIRKLVRRARASAWERAHDAPGITVEHGSAEVRAFVPGPMSEAPPEVAKLQIQSTAIIEPDPIDSLRPLEPDTLVLVVNPEISMSWGKMAAQTAHAGQRAWQMVAADAGARWEGSGMPIVAIRPTPRLWDELFGRADVTIHDGGFTEIAPGTLTTIAFWSDPPGFVPPVIDPRNPRRPY
ncbi:MAG: aminoacyl-tRNA hydrolase [Acidimicrobiales bacterium]